MHSAISSILHNASIKCTELCIKYLKPVIAKYPINTFKLPYVNTMHYSIAIL